MQGPGTVESAGDSNHELEKVRADSCLVAHVSGGKRQRGFWVFANTRWELKGSPLKTYDLEN